jgi:hypothetical protein
VGTSVGGGDDRIGLLIETQANLSGLKAARTETQAYANDVKSIASSAVAAGSATQISAEQGRAAWAAAGGDYAKFQEILGGIAAQQLQVGESATEAGALIVKANEGAAASEQALASSTASAAEAQSTALVLVGNAAEKSAAQQEFGSRAAVQAGRAFDAISPKTRSAANAFAILSQIAVTGNGSLAGIANAAGLAGQSIASLATSARVAMLASGIGAIITVGATVIGVLMSMRTEAKATAAEMEHVGNISSASAASAALADARAKRDAAAAKYQSAIKEDIRDFLPWTNSTEAKKEWEQAQSYVDALTAKTSTLRVAETARDRDRQLSYTREFQDQAQSLLMQERMVSAQSRSISDIDSQAEQKHQQMTEELAIQQRQLEQSYIQRDAQGQIIPLTAEEIRQRNELLSLQGRLNDAQQQQMDRETQMTKDAADRAAQTRIRTSEGDLSGNVGEQYAAKIQQYQDEEDAAIRAGESRTNAEKETELKIRALRKQTASDAMSNYSAITNALVNSNSRALKAIGGVGDVIRKVLIGADGAHSAVLAIKEGAAAIGSLAVGDFKGAALHGASALEYGKAAALALTESLGSSSSGGGGGGGSSNNTTFQPTNNQGSGNQVLVLNTVDPYSGAAINSVAYELQRGQVLKKPIYIPPTTGFAAASSSGG